jgi:hypothetical protein
MQAAPNTPANQTDLNQQRIDAINHNDSAPALSVIGTHSVIGKGADSNATMDDTPALWFASDQLSITHISNVLVG